jgi:hypothetical protein
MLNVEVVHVGVLHFIIQHSLIDIRYLFTLFMLKILRGYYATTIAFFAVGFAAFSLSIALSMVSIQ